MPCAVPRMEVRAPAPKCSTPSQGSQAGSSPRLQAPRSRCLQGSTATANRGFEQTLQLSAPPTAKHRAAWASSQHLPGARGFLTTPCLSSPYGSFENPATNTMSQLVQGSRFPPAFLPLPSSGVGSSQLWSVPPVSPRASRHAPRGRLPLPLSQPSPTALQVGLQLQ